MPTRWSPKARSAEADAQALVDDYRDKLDAGEVTTELVKCKPDEFTDRLVASGCRARSPTRSTPRSTRQTLDELAKMINTIPAGVKLHPRVAKIYDDRRKMAAGELAGDWGFAENLAYATLLERRLPAAPGRPGLRPRHVLPPPRDPARAEHRRYYLPLRQLVKNPADVTIIDSLLSEEAVMAFEYGYSTADPKTLDIWEASSATSPTARRW